MQDFPALDFHHGETIDMLRATVRQFAADEIAPRAGDIDRTNTFPMDLWRKMGDLGVLGITASQLPGPAGNVEYFLWLRQGAPPLDDSQLERAIKEGPS